MTGSYDYAGSFAGRAGVALADPKLRAAVASATSRADGNRLAVLESLADAESLKDLAAEIRDAVLSRLDVHLDMLAETWEHNGGRIFFAAGARDASDYVARLATDRGITSAIKSKSMVSEEIGLNETLESAGVDVVETDLGEYIIQLAGDPPSHIIAPAIHMSKADVAELFSQSEGRALPEDAPALMAYARAKLRERFLSAGLGISGVNFAVSEEGALCIVTNEGNARMCTSLPPVHVAVMGMERVVGNFDELAVMLALLGRSGTGQKLTQYTTLLFGPRRASEADGPEESHLVVVDAGRTNILGTEYQEALRCIRCGACLNVCPVYRQVGGHAYDPVYSGPIGAVINPLLHDSPQAAELAHASTLCGACTEACPVRIPLDDLLLRLRRDYAARHASVTERALYAAWSRAWAGPRRYGAFSALGSLAGRLTGERSFKRLPLPVLGRWTKGRSFPGFTRSASSKEKR